MRKNKFLFLAVTILSVFSACNSQSYLKARIEIPAFSPLNLSQYEEIFITDFLVEKAPRDFDWNKELKDYFASELGRKIKGKISAKNIAPENPEAFKKPEFWINLASSSSAGLFLTGKGSYTQETRKAILEREARRLEDAFSSEKTLAERTVFTFELSLYLIRGETGEVLYERTYKETKAYENPKQRPEFAFFELLQRVKTKFFRQILGEERMQERYLLLK